MPIDRSNYPADWDEISKRIRVDRSGGRCECLGECGIQHDGHDTLFERGEERCDRINGDPIPGNEERKTVLTTAHLDQDTWNNEDGNLKALCQGCHLRYDAKWRREH